MPAPPAVCGSYATLAPLGERVDRDGVFSSRRGPGEGVVSIPLLSKMAERCGSAAPLCGRALPFRAEMAMFLSSSPRRRLSLRRGEDEVGCLRRVPGRRSQPA